MEEQLATPISELLILILYLGSITFLLGALVQIYIIYRNKKSKVKGIIIVLLTRLLTIISSYFIFITNIRFYFKKSTNFSTAFPL